MSLPAARAGVAGPRSPGSPLAASRPRREAGGGRRAAAAGPERRTRCFFFGTSCATWSPARQPFLPPRERAFLLRDRAGCVRPRPRPRIEAAQPGGRVLECEAVEVVLSQPLESDFGENLGLFTTILTIVESRGGQTGNCTDTAGPRRFRAEPGALARGAR